MKGLVFFQNIYVFNFLVLLSKFILKKLYTLFFSILNKKNFKKILITQRVFQMCFLPNSIFLKIASQNIVYQTTFTFT